MSAQPSLFEAAAAHADQAGKRSGSSLRQSFEDFHAQNPHVLEALRARALHVKRSGWRSYGAKALVEAARFDPDLSTNGQPWKLNNNFTASYARLLMDTTPELRGFFRVKD